MPRRSGKLCATVRRFKSWTTATQLTHSSGRQRVSAACSREGVAPSFADGIFARLDIEW
jgi:hypothetical protein